VIFLKIPLRRNRALRSAYCSIQAPSPRFMQPRPISAARIQNLPTPRLRLRRVGMGRPSRSASSLTWRPGLLFESNRRPQWSPILRLSCLFQQRRFRNL